MRGEKRSDRNKSPRGRNGWLVVVLLGGVLAWAAPAASRAAPEAVQETSGEATYECTECHETMPETLAHKAHAVLDTMGWASSMAGASSSCIACHGAGLEHIEAVGDAPIFAFDEDQTPWEKADRCLTCHDRDHPRFAASAHARASMACTDCHSIHGLGEFADGKFIDPEPGQEGVYEASLDLMDRTSAVCSRCHQDVFTQFMFTERHDLEEGAIECTSCHNPHAPQTRIHLGGFKQQACAECHTDKNGPFVFEHPANRVEGCVTCHEPHGSPNRHQLVFQDVAELCFSCHALVPGFHTRFTLDTQCTNCHSSIHGSNIDPAFLN